jgi:hypothetical protein
MSANFPQVVAFALRTHVVPPNNFITRSQRERHYL